MTNDSLPIAPFDGRDEMTLGWCMEALQESEAMLKAQDGYDLMDPCIRMIMGARPGPAGRLSNARSNRFGKIASDLAAYLTDTKPFWDYRTENQKFEKQQIINGKLSTNWYYRRQIDMKFMDMVRYWTVGGSSYAHLTFDTNVEDINCSAEDPRDVLPLRPGSFESIQNALGAIVRRERPVNYVRHLYPSKAHLITADRDAATSTGGGGATSAMFANLGATSPFHNALWGDAPKRTMPKVPVVDLYTLYVTDMRRNETSHEVAIGQFDDRGKPVNNWSYMVQPGEKLYPNKRMIQFTKTAVLYDSTSPYWHGMFPLAKFTLDHWPWSWLGKAPLWDLLPLQEFLDRTLRVIDDLQAKLVQPDVVASKQSMSRAAMNTLNTRAAGQKLFTQGLGKADVQLVYPQVGSLDFAFKVKQLITEEMDTLSGIRDLSQLMQLGQVPGAETIEKIMESMTPSNRGRSRTMEAFIREFAQMLAYDFAQFYNDKKRFLVMGPDGLTGEDIDFDPGTYIPAYIHPEDLDVDGNPTLQAQERGPRPRMERAKFFMEQFTFHVVPGSLLVSSEITDKLMYLQLARAGLIDRWTLLEKLGIPNVGEPPGDAKTVTDRLYAEQMMGLGMAASTAGRKATGQSMPKMETKDGGTRSTISESG